MWGTLGVGQSTVLAVAPRCSPLGCSSPGVGRWGGSRGVVLRDVSPFVARGRESRGIAIQTGTRIGSFPLCPALPHPFLIALRQLCHDQPTHQTGVVWCSLRCDCETACIGSCLGITRTLLGMCSWVRSRRMRLTQLGLVDQDSRLGLTIRLCAEDAAPVSSSPFTFSVLAGWRWWVSCLITQRGITGPMLGL